MAKLSISRAWDETKALLARDGKLFTTVALALFVLPGVISDVVTPPAPAGELPEFGYWTVVTAIAIVIALIGQLAVIRLAIGSGQTVGEAITHGAWRSPAYIAAGLLWLMPFVILISFLLPRVLNQPQDQALPAATGFLVLMAVMLFIAIRMLMTSPVASAESAGPLDILRRSWRLTRGHWWKLFVFFLLFVIAAIVVLMAVGAVFGSLAELVLGDPEPLSLSALLASLVTQLLSAVVSVIFMAMLARIYVQLAGSVGAEVSVPTSGS